MDQPIITEDNPRPFVVKVKLLTNETFEFQVSKDMKVSQFKTLISPKVNVPIDRMRMVFAGRQLVDDKPLSQYVTQSGLTIHLIARSAPVQQQPQSAQNVRNQPSSNNQPQSIPVNPLGDIMGMMSSMFGAPVGGVQQSGSATSPQITMSFGGSNMPNMNNLGGLLGSLGIRIPPPPASQNIVPPQPPTSQQNASSENRQNRISYAQIGQLNQTLNTLNVPLDNVTTEQQLLTPEGVVRYLRRLHHQSTRSMMQLNRLLNFAQQGNNTSSLQNFIPVFQSLNSVNNVAIDAINQLHHQRNQNNVTTNANTSTNNNNNTQNRNQMQNSNRQSNPQNQQSQQSQQNQNSLLNTQARVAQTNANNQQIPMMSQPGFNPMQMLGGLNLGNLMGGLQSVGGIGGLFGMSIREMMSQNGEQPNSILIDIFGGMTGQHLMQTFTTKNFAFLKQNRGQIRQKLKKKIDQSNQQAVVQQITQQVSTVLIPTRDHPTIPNIQQCSTKCKQNLRKHIREFVKITLSQNQPDYDLKAVQIGKMALCQNIDIITNHTSNKNQNVAFQVIKSQAISTLDPVLPGLAGMLYSIIQRDIIRVYNQHKAEQERKNTMTAQQTQSEQKLIQLIKQAGNRDSAKLANMPHSQFYHHQ